MIKRFSTHSYLFRISILFLLYLICIFFPLHAFAQSNAMSATVPPRASDFQFDFSTGNGQATVNENTSITYDIHYGAHASAGTPTTVTIIADFSNDTVAGEHILAYVTGSATNGYTNSVPIIDLVQRTITWTIPSLPAGVTDQIVSFQLKTTGNNLNTDLAPFTVKATMNNQYIQFPEQSITKQYHFLGIIPTTATQKPPEQLAFSTISLLGVSDTTLTITVNTSVPAIDTVVYGTSPNRLDKRLESSPLLATHQTLTLSKLTPNTTYYLKVIATDRTTPPVISEIYSFTTAKRPYVSPLEKSSVIFLSDNHVLSLFNPQEALPLFILPKNFSYSIRLQITNGAFISHIQAILRKRLIPGRTPTQSPNTTIQEGMLEEITNEVFEGGLKTPAIPDTYQLFFRISDTAGNIQEIPIANITVSNYLRVMDALTHQPIESAQVTLFYQNFTSGTYTLLSPQLFSATNPLYTNTSGESIIFLPQGHYKATITAIGYKQQKVTFTLGANPSEIYPTIFLTREPFSLTTLLIYYGTILLDTLQKIKLALQGISLSSRFFDSNALLITITLGVLSFLSFTKRLKIPPHSFLNYFIPSGIARLRTTLTRIILRGAVIDQETKKSLGDAEVYLLDEKTQKVLGHILTKSDGSFAFSVLSSIPYSFNVMKDNYAEAQFSSEEASQKAYLFPMVKNAEEKSSKERVLFLVTKVVVLMVECFLVLSCISEIFIGIMLGFEKTSMFLLFSLINLVLWLRHLMRFHSNKHGF